jgi:hypothetical protein
MRRTVLLAVAACGCAAAAFLAAHALAGDPTAAPASGATSSAPVERAVEPAAPVRTGLRSVPGSVRPLRVAEPAGPPAVATQPPPAAAANAPAAATSAGSQRSSAAKTPAQGSPDRETTIIVSP